MAVVSAAAISFEQLVKGFNDGYTGYLLPVQVDKPELRHHIEQHDVDFSSSCAAVDGDLITGVGLLAVRDHRGWVGGLGVHPGYRRQGVGRRLMAALIEQCRTHGLSTLQLEVLDKNTPAHQLYLSMGFADHRRLHVLDYRPETQHLADSAPIESCSLEYALQLHRIYHHVHTPWQRGYESLKKADAGVEAWIVPGSPQPPAYAVGYIFDDTIHLLDLACTPGHEAALTGLVASLHHQHPEARGRLVNIAEDEPGYAALSALGWQIALSQYEMVLSP